MTKEIFSTRESKIIKILGKRKMTIAQITERLYKDVKKAAFGMNNNVASAIRRINAKCEHHDIPWHLNGMGAGRGGRTVWRDKR